MAEEEQQAQMAPSSPAKGKASKSKNKPKAKGKSRSCSGLSVHEPAKTWSGRLAGLKQAKQVFGGDVSSTSSSSESENEDSNRELGLAGKQRHFGVPTCSTCGLQFSDADSQRQHFKLDWHRYNIKARLQGRAALDEESFERLVVKNAADDDDQLSISGSEDEEDDETDTTESELEAAPPPVTMEESTESGSLCHRHPKLFMVNEYGQLLSVHKCLLTGRKDNLGDESQDSNGSNLVEKFQMLMKESHTCDGLQWAVFMLGGGHFAGAIFRGSQAVLHKTFHCYTVRAKQGGSQGAADKKGGHHRSAGASLRRYNEAALVQHVQDIIKEWQTYIKNCSLIFYRAASNNRSVLFGGKEPPLSKTDPRLRAIPFPTRRATFSEVKRIHELLSLVTLHGALEDFLIEKAERSRQSKPSTKRAAKKGKGNISIRRSKSREDKIRPLPRKIQELADKISTGSDSDDEDSSFALENLSLATSHLKEFDNSAIRRRGKKNKKKVVLKDDQESKEAANDLIRHSAEIELTNQLITACKSGNLSLLHSTCSKDNFSAESELSEFVNKPLGDNRLTALHLAASAGQRSAIKALMELGADPCNRDKLKRVPYALCPDKESRNAFRDFAGAHPERYDYRGGQIPPPASEEQLQRQKEKKARQNAARRTKEKEKKVVEAEQRRQEDEKRRFLALSDREKRALAAERRILASTEDSKPVLQRCFSCGVDISGKVPFEYENFQFCTVKCLQEHRKKMKSSSK